MPISDVHHQPRAQRILQRARSSNRLPHAYIFHGPEGVGKEMLAMRFAQLLLCEDPQSLDPPDEADDGSGIAWQDACGVCQECRLFAADTHPDMQIVHKTLNRYHPAPEVRNRKAIDLSVDVIRHFVIERAHDRPSRGRARVFLIRDAEDMSVSAQNALLKTLEEPPGASFLILLTRSLDRLLPTTLSRCQPVPFGTLPREFVETALQAALPETADDIVRFLAAYCQGRLGLALRLARANLYESKKRLIDALANLSRVGPSGLAKVIQEEAGKLAQHSIEEMVEAGLIDKASEAAATEPTRRGLREMLSLASSLYRDAIQATCGRDDRMIHGDQAGAVRRLASEHSLESLAEAAREIYRTETEIAGNANVTLALEGLAIRLLRRRSPTDRAALRPARGDRS